MHSTVIHLLFLFSVIKASWQVDISFANESNQRYHMRQMCSELPPAVCCVPLDVSIGHLGWGWFRAKYLLFQDLPRYNLHLAGFNSQRSRSDCDGVLVVQHRTGGEAIDTYANQSPEGFSGSLYALTASNGNRTGMISETVQAPFAPIKYPDVIYFQGAVYYETGEGSLVYSSVDGKTINGAPLLVIVNTVAGRPTGLSANRPEDANITTS